MSETKWTVVPGDSVLLIRRADGERVAIVGGGPYWERFTEETKRTAHLISAAPELYEALADLVENKCSEHCDWEAARAALAKARGESVA